MTAPSLITTCVPLPNVQVRSFQLPSTEQTCAGALAARNNMAATSAGAITALFIAKDSFRMRPDLPFGLLSWGLGHHPIRRPLFRASRTASAQKLVGAGPAIVE